MGADHGSNLAGTARLLAVRFDLRRPAVLASTPLPGWGGLHPQSVNFAVEPCEEAWKLEQVSSHNELAFRAGRWILDGLRTASATWAPSGLTTAVTLSPWFEDWPRPDLTYADPRTDRSLAVEFKPPGHGKREYVTGLGQCLTYLNMFDYAVLFLPQVAIDGFRIADYLVDTVRAPSLATASLGILAYDDKPDENVAVAEVLRERLGAPVGSSASRRSTFWGYWRDLSNYDLLLLLSLIDQKGSFDNAWKWFWTRYLSTGNAKTWEGNLRTAQSTAHDAQRLNTDLSLRHAGLVSGDGRLTESGLVLLQLGKIYGADGLAFLDELARCVLIAGRHIDLIYWIADLQVTLPAKALRTSTDFVKALDAELVREGVIKPPSGHAKPAHVRDEPKLWNKLGLLRRRTGTQYFHPKIGWVFDWRRISGILAAR